jgi:hypothetical protein
MEIQIKVHGTQAKQIKKGDFFIPEFDSVEGRTVVTLVKNNGVKELLKKYDERVVALDDMIRYLRDLVGDEQDGS